MKKMSLFLGFVLVLGLIEGFWFYPLLPARMATHFGASGAADGWGPKDSFFRTIGITFFALAALFAGMPYLFRFMPDSLINLPNKDYWLAPERREDTLDRLSRQLIFFGATALLFLEAIFYLCFQANISNQPGLNSLFLWSLLAVFIAINGFWIVSMMRSYSRPTM